MHCDCNRCTHLQIPIYNGFASISRSDLLSANIGTASGGKKQPGKQVAEKPQQSQSSRNLPSNWEEFVSDWEDTAEGSSSQATDIVRKSKSADYAYLLSEAKAQSVILPISIHNSMMSLMGLGLLLSARGQGNISWIADDDFKLEDKSTTSYEAPFLSLNMHALAEQLAKANVSKRLFAEPDLLTLELIDELQESSEDEIDFGQISYGTHDVETNNNVSSLSQEPEENILKQHNRESISSATTITRDLTVPTATDQRPFSELISNFNVDLATKKSTRFEAAYAEAELDMLLDSISETKFFEISSVTKRSNNLTRVQQEDESRMDPAKSLNNVMN
ncbi:Hypothetical predicted protein [Olea europaea subsp. europaea]|uniref:Uncharacterized protein n=1 Tax=Olea europaea subsp. europaea TaxID=158383 RepID=A0A8S0PI28_OLEEU|nr:Hypothetical predicted protein [Olea europaea subsp. europaea]